MKAGSFDNSADLPGIFINVIRKRENIECQTLELVKLNLRLSDASNEAVIRSDSVIQHLIKELRQDASQLFRVCESVALVDMITAFGQLATTRDYIRPEITGTLALQAARHPIMDKVSLVGIFHPVSSDPILCRILRLHLYRMTTMPMSSIASTSSLAVT